MSDKILGEGKTAEKQQSLLRQIYSLLHPVSYIRAARPLESTLPT
jgi:hypothetical protein